MPGTQKEEFHTLMEKLAARGESEKDLSFWESIFDDLSETEKDEILLNLKKELETLGE